MFESVVVWQAGGSGGAAGVQKTGIVEYLGHVGTAGLRAWMRRRACLVATPYQLNLDVREGGI